MASEPLRLQVDLDHGGRWTSLRTPGREWLWTNPDAATRAARARVRPGDGFVDAGGVEECFPTLRGTPDHGDVWSRPWTGTVANAAVGTGLGTGGLRLGRRVSPAGDAVRVDYDVRGEPGTPFVHAVHALLDVGPDARLEVPEARTMLVLDVEDPRRTWPDGLDRLGPDDGTAVCALLPRCHQALVVDGEDRLQLDWASSTHPELCSLVLWRNLGGWPDAAPYRSIGVEATLGRSVDLTTPRTEPARLDVDGRASWSLTLTAGHR